MGFMNQSTIISGTVTFEQIRGSGRSIVQKKFVIGMEGYYKEVKLETKRVFYMELDVQDLDYKMPLYLDVLEEKTFTFTSEESRFRIQINMFRTFL